MLEQPRQPEMECDESSLRLLLYCYTCKISASIWSRSPVFSPGKVHFAHKNRAKNRHGYKRQPLDLYANSSPPCLSPPMEFSNFPKVCSGFCCYLGLHTRYLYMCSFSLEIIGKEAFRRGWIKRLFQTQSLRILLGALSGYHGWHSSSTRKPGKCNCA